MFNRPSFPAPPTFAVLAAMALLPTPAAAQSSGSTYRGYHVDLSKLAGRQDFAAIADSLRHQLDIVESVGLNPRVLEFFHTVPIVVSDEACPKHPSPACYNGRLIMAHPLAFDAQRPILLHEMLHAYHGRLLPQGEQNPDILLYYNRAKNNQFYPAGEYLLTNHREFFAMTASVFLYGKAARAPHTRAKLKEKQPIYFEYLTRLFGVHPDSTPSVASTAPAAGQGTANAAISPAFGVSAVQNRASVASAPSPELLAMALSWNQTGGWAVQKDPSPDVARNNALARCNGEFGNCSSGAAVTPTAPGCLTVARANEDTARLFAAIGGTLDAASASIVQQLRNEGMTGRLEFSECNSKN